MSTLLLLAVLVAKARVNLTPFHRARVTPAKRSRGGWGDTTADAQEQTAAEHHASMRWAQRLKRVFGIAIETQPAVAR